MDKFRTVMRLGRKLVLATTCVLGLSGAGEAAELFTPLLLISPGNSISCVVSNVSERDTTVLIEAFSLSGASLGSGEIVLPAGETGAIHVAVEHARCKFTVQNRNDVRAHGTVYHTGVGSTSSAEAK